MVFDDLAEITLKTARSNGVILATAESCTGGLISAALTEIPGSSGVFDRGFVTYSNDAKIDMLGIDPNTLKAQGAVSEATAKQMAEGALRYSKANLAVSVTGIAGPGGSDHKPEGRVCFGIAQTDRPTRTETLEFKAIGRANVRIKTVEHALLLLTKTMTSRIA